MSNSDGWQCTAMRVGDISAKPSSTGISLVRRRAPTRGPPTFQQLFLWDYFNLKSGARPQGALVLKIVGSLDNALLARSVTEVVRRHDCLRTRIVTTDGTLEQEVHEPTEFDLEVLDLIEATQTDRETQAREFLHEFGMRTCDLAVDSPIAIALVRMSTREHLVACAIHHLVVDGISFGLVLDEFWSVYRELQQGRQPHLGRKPASYLDYAIWQHETHQDWLQKHERYWIDRIATAARVRLFSDLSVASHERANAEFKVGGMPPLADVRRVARSARTIPAMVMLTVYAAVIARWCGQTVFTIPLNAAGRCSPLHDRAVGYYAQFLYVVVEIVGDETFLELLAKVCREFREALLHQDFGKVSAQVTDVLLGSMFSWIPWRLETLGLPPSSMANDLGFSAELFPLTLAAPDPPEFHGIGATFCEAEGEYSTTLCYVTNSFSTTTIDQFASELRSLCERAVTNQHCLVFEKRNG